MLLLRFIPSKERARQWEAWGRERKKAERGQGEPIMAKETADDLAGLKCLIHL